MKKLMYLVLAVAVLAGSAVAEPVAHWKFDEGSGTTAYDSAGDNDGTIYGSQWTAGQVDGALSFDGVDNYVFVGDKDNLDFESSDSFSISAWIKLSSHIYAPIVDKRKWVSCPVYGCFDEGYTFAVYQDKLYFGVEDVSDNGKGAYGSNILTNDEWHHVVAIRDTATDKLYIFVDGNLDAIPVTDTTVASLATSVPLQIGKKKAASPGVDYHYFNGLIDDVMIFDRALTAEEVEQLYQDGLSRYELAISKIVDAIAEKEVALEATNYALENEWVAGKALRELLFSGDHGELERKDIIKSMIRLYVSMRREHISKRLLEKSIGDLEKSLEHLGWEPEPEPEPNLIGYWKFDEGEGTTTADSVGDNDGTVYGAQWTTGQVDWALEFDGVDDYVEVSDDSSLEPQNITVAAWVFRESTSTRDTILQKGSTSYLDGRNGYFFRILESSGPDFNKAVFYIVVNNANKVSPVTVTPIEAHSWYHIAATYDGSNIRIYVNGVEEGIATSETGTIDYTGGQQQLKIGVAEAGNGSPQNYFDGTVDDVRVYDRALSADQIQQLYLNGLN